MAGHWFEQVQWSLPTAENYQWLRDLFNRTGEDYLRREYEDLRQEYEDLRRKYEDLRREYEELRRPFHVTADVPYTDVWTFPTVQAYKGKHPCEKPIDMMEHIVRASSRPGAVVLDCFGGSGTTAHAAVRLGRKAVMIEADEKWCRKSTARIKHQAATLYSIEPSTQAADTQPGETPK
jgi:site-specific DNA-methyltransferase (adenine-specific)